MSIENSKKLKPKLVLILIVLVALIILNIAVVIIKVVNSPLRLIEKKWNLILPSNIQLEYQKNEIGWFGEGKRYSVFKIKKEQTEYFIDFLLNSESIREATEKTLSQMQIASHYLPNWNESFYGKMIGQPIATHICLLYFSSAQTLIICEEFY